ncbi:MAG: MotA/TolQ/ExbB proton channel family protein [candidate division KSB1 bacterium]|nr:MotA/TolQ/ExbB proton channel family protein [candidate division KSB1 bacterium]MDQ7065317.1 MotA/TolQ/ExbB proton channel family protein [candidate division KSB1 bacterium]
MLDTIVRFFQQGGGFMFAILGVLVISIAIMIERFIYLSVKNRIDEVAFVNRILDFIQKGQVSSAIEYCNMSKAALPQITKAGLEEFGKSPADIQNALELAAMSEIPKLEKRTPYLSMFANVATLLGLLGTIFGLINSFEAVASADASQKATLLSAGISVAMNTTAFGLIAAIPALIGYSYLQEKTNELIDSINENVARIYRRMVSAGRN